jgi:hypothetical protein
MKRKLFKCMLVVMSIFMTTTFCACSDDDDEPISGAEQLQQVKATVNSFTAYSTDTEYTYCVAAKDSSEAKSICESIIGETWNGSTQTVTLNDNYGTIRVLPGTESGVFIKMVFDLKDTNAVTLLIATEEYAKSENKTDLSKPQVM